MAISIAYVQYVYQCRDGRRGLLRVQMISTCLRGVPQKKIMSRSFLNSGTLIVNTDVHTCNCMLTHTQGKIMMICEFSVTCLPWGGGGGEVIFFKYTVSDYIVYYSHRKTHIPNTHEYFNEILTIILTENSCVVFTRLQYLRIKILEFQEYFCHFGNS